jgi:predicted DNA-binding protein (UPF0251 family)/predicted Fe-Mo cluster-binding NifX family protein
MPRPPMARILGSTMTKRGFRPSGVSSNAIEAVILTFDEAEALRLADLEGLYQQAAAQRMGVSRQTFGRIIESARRKTADALLNGKKLRVDGGVVTVRERETGPLLVAVPTTSRGQVETHFGRCERITIYKVGTDGVIQVEEIVEASIGPGCRSIVMARLAEMGVRALLVGCIGEGAIHVCGGHGIAVVRGASGAARVAAIAYARGELEDSGQPCGGACKAIGRGCR